MPSNLVDLINEIHGYLDDAMTFKKAGNMKYEQSLEKADGRCKLLVSFMYSNKIVAWLHSKGKTAAEISHLQHESTKLLSYIAQLETWHFLSVNCSAGWF